MRNERRFTRLAWLPMAVILAGGCILEDTSHSLYLSSDGSVSWVIIERDIRSDDKASNPRDREEAEFLDRARNGRHPVADALREFGSTRVESGVLRDERPFVVVTTGKFASIDALARELLSAHCLNGESRLERVGKRATWTMTVQSQMERSDCRESDLAGLFIERIVLTEGRFLEGIGFDINDEGHVAELVLAKVQDAPFTWSLVWELD